MSIINKYYVDEKWVLLKYDLNNYQKSDRGTPRWGQMGDFKKKLKNYL